MVSEMCVWKAELSKESLIQIFVKAEAEDPHRATGRVFFIGIV